MGRRKLKERERGGEREREEEGETNDIYFGGKFDEEAFAALAVCFRKFMPVEEEEE